MTENATPMQGKDADIQRWIIEQMSLAQERSRKWRANAMENYKFFAGDQWSDDDKAILREQSRPVVTFNRIARTIRGVAGVEVQNRQEVKYSPRELGDAGLNELQTAAADWVRDNCDAEDEESEAFQDVLICGLGYTETRMDYDKSLDGNILIERGDPMELFWDSAARKKNLGDRRWTARVKRWAPEEIKDKWPQWEKGKATKTWLEDSFETEPHDATPPFYTGDTGEKPTDKTSEVVMFQWFERESVVRVQNETGIQEFTLEQFAQIEQAIKNAGLQYVQQKRRVFYQAWLVGDELMEAGPAPLEDQFTLCPITGERDAPNGCWFGLGELMKDPQRWANKWLSQIMHILNSNAKGGLLAEVGAFENRRRAEEEWADPAAITWVTDGAIANGRIQQKQMVQMPVGIERLLQYAIEAISDVPGVNQELMGLVAREQPGVLEGMRKQAGITMLATYFDALRRYRKESGRVLAEMIRTYIADGRLIRIKQDSAQYIPLLRDKLSQDYDVIVDQAASSPNQKEQTFAVLQQIVPQLLEAGIRMPPETLDYLPLPESLIQKIKESERNGGMSPQMQEEHQQMQQQMQQMSEQLQQGQQQMQQQEQQGMATIQKLQAENQALKADRMIDMERVRLDGEKLEIEKAKVMRELQTGEAPVDDSGSQIEVWKAQLEADTRIRIAEISAQTAEAAREMELQKAAIAAWGSKSDASEEAEKAERNEGGDISGLEALVKQLSLPKITVVAERDANGRILKLVQGV